MNDSVILKIQKQYKIQNSTNNGRYSLGFGWIGEDQVSPPFMITCLMSRIMMNIQPHDHLHMKRNTKNIMNG